MSDNNSDNIVNSVFNQVFDNQDIINIYKINYLLNKK